MRSQSYFYEISWWVVLFLLFLPMLGGSLNSWKEFPLKGAFTPKVDSSFNWSNWWNGSFQTGREAWLSENYPGSTWLTRLHRQLEFSLLGKPGSRGIIPGKNGELFEYNYLAAINGWDRIPDDSISNTLQRFKTVQDSLAAKGKLLILLLTPGKAQFMPEMVPDHYRPSFPISTNYQYFSTKAAATGIHLMDFQRWFAELKAQKQYKYPLYAQYGVHWSYYGAMLAMDSIRQYLNTAGIQDLPRLNYDTIDVLPSKEADIEVEEAMNLLLPLPLVKRPYPRAHVVGTASAKSTLVVGDSYCWNLYNQNFQQLFSRFSFWYYNRTIYPESFNSRLDRTEVSLRQALQEHDVIILLCTDANLAGIGWGFIEEAHQLFTQPIKAMNSDPLFLKKQQGLANYIRSDKTWLNTIQQKAKERGITVDAMIQLDTEWLLLQEFNNWEKPLQP